MEYIFYPSYVRNVLKTIWFDNLGLEIEDRELRIGSNNCVLAHFICNYANFIVNIQYNALSCKIDSPKYVLNFQVILFSENLANY